MEWLSALADAGRNPSTIAVYKSALHTAWQEGAPVAPATPNPMDAPKIKQLLRGIRQDRAVVTQQQRAAKTAAPLTFDIVRELRQAYQGSTRERTHFASVALAVAACCRPSEVYGSAQHPERALRAHQIHFYADEQGRQRVHATRAGVALPPPPFMVVTLEVSKTDQQRKGTQKLVSADTAVAAMWQHCCEHADRGTHALLFTDAQGGRLTTGAAVAELRRKLTLHGRATLAQQISGRSFRQGGASELSAMGLDDEEIARFGWAAGSTVGREVYARNPAVQRSRAFAISRNMGELSARGATPTHAAATAAASTSSIMQ